MQDASARLGIHFRQSWPVRMVNQFPSSMVVVSARTTLSQGIRVGLYPMPVQALSGILRYIQPVGLYNPATLVAANVRLGRCRCPCLERNDRLRKVSPVLAVRLSGFKFSSSQLRLRLSVRQSSLVGPAVVFGLVVLLCV